MAGERQGWNYWTNYESAGIVDKHVNFTDNEVVTSHAIGKTKDVVGMCYPIDAAVAYTLAAAGPEANLTSAEMVNEYTRMATVMMSQKVAHGDVPDPRVESCEHDMVNAYTHSFMVPVVAERDDGVKHITWSKNFVVSITGSSHRVYSLREWLEKKGAPEELLEMSSIRLSDVIENNTNTAFSILMRPEYQQLRLYIERALECTTWLLINYEKGHSTQAFQVEHTTGVCGWKEDNEKNCAHHDRPMVSMWVLIKGENGGYEQLWSREKGTASVHGGWNSDQVRSTLGYAGVNSLTVDRVVQWEKVSRALAQSIDEKKVIKSINEALRRMSGRNMNVVTKEGLRNTATYNWKEWGWLTEMQAWVAQTSKKNRKEGDIVNGWVYSKYEKKMSYGHEIAKFKWTTEESDTLCTYTIKCKGSGYYNNSKMPFRFPDKLKAMQFKQFLTMMAVKTGATNRKQRLWDGDAGTEKVKVDDSFKVIRNNHRMEMGMLSDPEYLPNPATILQALMFGTPQEYDEHIQHLNKDTQSNFSKPKIVHTNSAMLPEFVPKEADT